MALSQVYADGHPVKWATAEKWTAKVLKKLTAESWPPGVLINVNFPDVTAGRVTGIEVTRQGRRKIGSELVRGTDPRGEPYYWIGNQKVSVTYAKGSDLAAIDDGKVSVTPLCLDLTHRPMMLRLKSLFPGAKSGPK